MISLKKILITAIKWYQKNISSRTPPACRHFPTCSNYAIEALEVHGWFFGSLLAVRRILMCNPCFKSRIDLVPEKKDKAKGKKLNNPPFVNKT